MHSRIAAITSGVRRLSLKGWSAASIASAYGVTVRTILTILDPPPQPFVLQVRRPARWRDQWKQAGWRFKDDVGVEPVAGLVTAEVIGKVVDAPSLTSSNEPVKPVPSTWSGPASPCQTSLPGGRRRRRD
jgi:hypothetical protein